MNQTIKNRLGENLDYSFATGTEATRKSNWIVLLGHGVTGNKDRPVIAETANALNAAGFDTLRFSFAGNGDSEGDFRNATISKEVVDLDSVIESVAETYPNIAYIGHSMGGAVGVLQAAKDRRLTALVSLAGMVDTETFAKTEFGELTPDEADMWDEPDCPLSSAYMNDLCTTVQNVSPLAECVSIPWLLIHGTADDVVLPDDTRAIQSIKGDAVNVQLIDGADHSFNDAQHKSQMTDAVTSWLQNLAT
ncbi:MAG: alpha/beta hydrolase [Opitutaceae bacterium]